MQPLPPAQLTAQPWTRSCSSPSWPHLLHLPPEHPLFSHHPRKKRPVSLLLGRAVLFKNLFQAPLTEQRDCLLPLCPNRVLWFMAPVWATRAGSLWEQYDMSSWEQQEPSLKIYSGITWCCTELQSQGTSCQTNPCWQGLAVLLTALWSWQMMAFNKTYRLYDWCSSQAKVLHGWNRIRASSCGSRVRRHAGIGAADLTPAP